MLELRELLEKGDADAIADFLIQNGLELSGNKIVPSKQKEAWVKSQITFWDQRQQARKILLNSLYGALLNEALRFADERMGQSVTLSGRSIVKHMNSETNNVLTGEYDYAGKAICYSDTDSCYFSAAFMMGPDITKEDYIKLYDLVAEQVNATFPEFMHKTFNTSLARGGIIAAGRELIASRVLFIKPKKYGALIYDFEKERMDTGKSDPAKMLYPEGKLKPMGLDLKRADTPKFMQQFLEKLLIDLLRGATEADCVQQIKDFRIAFKDRPSWEKGSPKKVNNLSKYRSMMERSNSMHLTDVRKKGEKARNMIPGHVRASVNWNNLCAHYNDKYTMRITDGTRIIVCKLKPNLLKMDAVAYPIDEFHLPKWFKDLPFDDPAMENVIIDKKVDNLLGCLKWNLKESKIRSGEEFFTF